MNKLLIRLAASGAIAAAMGGVALADSASIELTGPGSTNVIRENNAHRIRHTINNNIHTNNFNRQYARTGDVLVRHNTKVYGDGLRSGNAYNTNEGRNNVYVDNQNGNWGNWGNSGRGSGQSAIFLTGPYSRNAIASRDGNRFNSTINNNIRASNFNNQTARSGNVRITGNTLVTGVGGSGDAVNVNRGTNDISVSNSQPRAGGFGTGGGSGFISTTGPGSFNSISRLGGNNVNLRTNNNINATNSNYQNARSGDVVISGNTVVRGVGGSGTAYNSNSGENTLELQNN